MKKSTLKKYAELIVKVGGNVQKGQDVIVYANVEQEELAGYIVEAAYKAKAKTVDVQWNSDKVQKVICKKESLSTLSVVEDWQVEKQRYINKHLPVMIHIESSDPDVLRGVDQNKIALARQAKNKVIKPFRDERDNKYQWTIAGAASKEWAKKVFPELSTKKAVEKLWEVILFTSRCNEDPIKAWNEHNADLAKRTAYLNSLNLDYLHYESKNGTNFKVWMNPKALWLAGGETTLGTNVYFNPNIPTEECFTSPIKGKAEGTVFSTKPLSYQGQLIENFSITFKDGKAVSCKAEKGEDLLNKMINMDPNAGYLGEVALVPFTSPINQTGLLFYNTLYDENAVCHLALGMGFTNTIKDYEKYSKEELHNMGVNDATIHVDFMIGSSDLSITGYTKDGKKIAIFKNGVWAF